MANVTSIEVGVLLIVIALGCVFGNTLVITAICVQKSLRKTVHVFVVCLAISDVLVGLLNAPLGAFVELDAEWKVTSGLACKAFGYLQMLFLVSSVQWLTVISVSRYLYIARPRLYAVVFQERRSLIVVAGLWSLSAMLCFPPLVGWSEYGYKPAQGHCFVVWKNDVSYSFFAIVTCFVWPICCMAYSYYKIYKCNSQSQQSLKFFKNKVTPLAVKLVISKDCTDVPKTFIGSIKESQGSATKYTETNQHLLVTQKVAFEDARPAVFLVNSCVRHTVAISSEQNVTVDNEGSDNKVSTLPNIDIARTSSSVATESRKGSDNLRKSVLKTGQSFPKIEVKTSEVESDYQKQKLHETVLRIGKNCREKSAPSAAVILTAERRRNEEKALTRMFVSAVVVFFICWFPYVVIMLFEIFSTVQPPAALGKFSIIIGYANSLCNPIIYGVLNRKFRNAFSQLLCRKKRVR